MTSINKFYVISFLFFSILIFSCKKEVEDNQDNNNIQNIDLPEYADSTNRNYLTDYINLKSGKTPLYITFDKGKEEWAKYTLNRAKLYLVAIENFLDMPFPNPGYVLFNSYQSIPGASGVYGYNWIKLTYTETGKDCGTLLHEIGHAWFNSGTINNQDWFHESIVEFMPYAIYSNKTLGFSIKENNNLLIKLNDYKTCTDSYDKSMTYFNANSNSMLGYNYFFYYGKAVKIQNMLMNELGMQNYRTFLKTVYQNRQLPDAQAIVDILNQIKSYNWNNFISGWIFDGNYTKVNISDFHDYDFDKLTSFEEIYLGTNPNLADTDNDLIPDGTEVELGYNPLVADNTNVSSLYAPFVDGKFNEWSVISYGEYSEGLDTNIANYNPAYDLIKMNYHFNDTMCFIALHTLNKPINTDNIRIYLFIDTDFDGKQDYQIGVSSLNNNNNIMNNATNVTTYWIPNILNHTNDIYEISFPISILNNKTSFNIKPSIRNQVLNQYQDIWETYVKIDKTLQINH